MVSGQTPVMETKTQNVGSMTSTVRSFFIATRLFLMLEYGVMVAVTPDQSHDAHITFV